MTEHFLKQSANDWAMCSCGKLFSDSKSMSAIDKVERHIHGAERGFRSLSLL